MVPIQSSAVLHQLVAVAVGFILVLVLLVVLVVVVVLEAPTLVVQGLQIKVLLEVKLFQAQLLVAVVRVPWVLMALLLPELVVLE
jgi:hypothetical protein